MAILRDGSTGIRHVLRPYHLFGRSPSHANSVLSTPNISLMHACARWENGLWTLTDQSRNGCFINGQRLAKALPVALQVDDEIWFGTVAGSPWQVEDLSPPADMLLPVTAGARTITLASVHNLPDDAAPGICLYRAGDGQWFLETLDGAVPLDDGDPVSMGAETWHLVCASPQPSTVVPGATCPCLRFDTSQDEEHVSLTVSRGPATQALGERSHHYLLMLLARQRLSDAARGFDSQAMGWVEFDRLSKWLGMDKAHINIQIFRLRKQFEEIVTRGLIQQDFIERRRGGVRLGPVDLEIWKGSTLEGTWTSERVAAALG